ncbi:lantibiotic ABC transporter permease [Ruthenibacterium lactatiformans]|uniref:Lantibiotic ABC transporter permease n=1 Tax=Ruthenibacterium lactatiformans TaxID=1550024 RepID=A0A0W7TS71_9FIRM|nr:ABC transporter permease [Ruthenibacterium lactatiformans]KUE76698.1 lantibiotic ABC transporter permease [Ruthenibacterium lactatiformans]
MAAIIKTEFLKVKRYYILWAGVGLMLLSVLLTLFTSTANDGTVWDFAYLTEQVIKNNMTMTFPMCITLIAGYIISREWTDDTIKNILTVPISFKRLLTGKLVLCGALALLFGIVSTLFTILAEMLVKFPGFTFPLVMQAFFQITMECFFLYLAVMPIIVLTSRIPGSFLVGVIVSFVYGYGGIFAAGSMTLSNIYPVTACLGLIGYRSYDKAVTWNLPMCLLSIFLIVGISVILIVAGKDKEPKKSKRNKGKQPARKKGW